MKTASRTLSARVAAPFRVRVKAAFALALVAAFVAAFAGCGCLRGYQVGPYGLYNTDIKTVYVQMVDADTYRTAFGERLTEAICKKITEQTPYRIGLAENADSLLAVRLTSETQSIAAYNRYDDTREKNVRLAVTAVWKDLHSNKIMGETTIPPVSMNDGVTVESNAYLVPEMGQSTTTVQQEAIEKIAEQIVGLMETAW